MRSKSLIPLSLLVLLLFLVAAWQPVVASPESKIDSFVLAQLEEVGSAEFLVIMADQADASNNLRTKEQKGQYVFDTLTAHATASQADAIAQLESMGAEYRSFWITNMLWVRGDSAVANAMAERADVARIDPNPTVIVGLPSGDGSAIEDNAVIEWNVAHINADDVWLMGIDGAGAVVAGEDTGYEWDHPALQNQYRGWDGVSADHDYNWHDAIHSGGGSCGADSPTPCDDHNHGTHTMGTMVGDDGGTNQIGVAPGAEWIGCRNMDVGNGTPTTYIECFEFFGAPYPVGGDPMNDGDPSFAPHAINNSWGCPVSEGCNAGNFAVMEGVIQNLRDSGIVVVSSAGNGGAGCSSVNTPAAIYGNVFSVGSTTSSDFISGFSSRGPVTVDGSNRMKPDISAPGSGIRSSVRGGGYQAGWSGTSMAAPHIVGTIALMISANPAIAGDVDLIEQIIEDTAVPLTTSQGCGGDGATDVPNNVYGHGRVDALEAVNAALAASAVDLQSFDSNNSSFLPLGVITLVTLAGITAIALRSTRKQ